MTHVPTSSWLRALLAAACLQCLFLAGAQAADVPSPTQARGSPAQPHNAVALWREVRSGEPGITTVRGTESGVLVSPDGNTWRQLRNGPITLYGGTLLLLVGIAITLFHRWKGSIRLEAKPTGRSMARFSNWERRLHWLVAISFVLLALTGLNLLFGKYLLMPVVGHEVFSWLAALGKYVHNFLGFVFATGVILMLATFFRDNFWHPSDAEWIRQAGGLVSRKHVPSRRFNFGEKTWFWFGVGLFGLTMVASGFSLLFPILFETRHALQTAEVVHAIAAICILAMSFGHIYLGTIGVEGAYQSMKTGKVDETWAREHHELWYNQQKLGKPEQGAQ